MANILHSIYGRFLGTDKDYKVVATNGFLSGEAGSQIALPSPSTIAQFDDFLGDVVGDEWNYVEGTDTTTADGAVVAGAVGGVFRLTGGDSAGTVAADGAELNSGSLQWKASSGGLVFQARVALGSIASVSCFVGFTDNTALEAPIQASGTANGITTNASDAVGFMFDTSMTDDNWWLVGVKGDTDATAQNTGIAPVAATYETLRIELDASGNATFFRNGVSVGVVMSNAVTASVGLTPVFIVWPRTAAAGKTLDIDLVSVSANR